ncbi:MAG: DUF6197 family protein [Pyrinomonadaceae bacterium]
MEHRTIRQAIKVLEKAKALIQLPKHWTQGEYARDSEDRGCHWLSPKAVKFCAAGALRRVAGSKGVNKTGGANFLTNAATQIAPNLPCPNYVCVNDGWGHRAVLRMYRLAIALAKKQLSSQRSGRPSKRQHRESESGG